MGRPLTDADPDGPPCATEAEELRSGASASRGRRGESDEEAEPALTTYPPGTEAEGQVRVSEEAHAHQTS